MTVYLFNPLFLSYIFTNSYYTLHGLYDGQHTYHIVSHCLSYNLSFHTHIYLCLYHTHTYLCLYHTHTYLCLYHTHTHLCLYHTHTYISASALNSTSPYKPPFSSFLVLNHLLLSRFSLLVKFTFTIFKIYLYSII